MNVNCSDRDSIFEDGTPAEWAALETHAANCAACAEEVRAWKALSVAAAELRDYSPSPALWSRIETALAANSAPAAAPVVPARDWIPQAAAPLHITKSNGAAVPPPITSCPKLPEPSPSCLDRPRRHPALPGRPSSVCRRRPCPARLRRSPYTDHRAARRQRT